MYRGYLFSSFLHRIKTGVGRAYHKPNWAEIGPTRICIGLLYNASGLFRANAKSYSYLSKFDNFDEFGMQVCVEALHTEHGLLKHPRSWPAENLCLRAKP